MRSNSIIRGLILVFFSLFSGISLAQAFSWNIELKQALDQKYAAFDHKVGICSDLGKQRKIGRIEDSWFETLSVHQQKVALLAASYLAHERCAYAEELDYSEALLRYTAETGDQTLLEAWLVLKKSPVLEDAEQILNGISWSELKAFSEKKALYEPFDLRSLMTEMFPE